MPEETAYHEAGHAFVAFYLGAQVRSVTVAPDRDEGPERFGDTQILWELANYTGRELCANTIRVALAGPVAEMIYRGEPYHPGFVGEWAADWGEAWHAATDLVADERKRLAYLEQVTAELYRLLNRDDYWAAIAAVSDNLLAHEQLENEDIEEILSAWLN